MTFIPIPFIYIVNRTPAPRTPPLPLTLCFSLPGLLLIGLLYGFFLLVILLLAWFGKFRIADKIDVFADLANVLWEMVKLNRTQKYYCKNAEQGSFVENEGNYVEMENIDNCQITQKTGEKGRPTLIFLKYPWKMYKKQNHWMWKVDNPEHGIKKTENAG